MNEGPIFTFYLGKIVLVETQDYAVVGRLIRYELGRPNPHRPMLLVLESMQGNWLIVNGWNKISSLE